MMREKVIGKEEEGYLITWERKCILLFKSYTYILCNFTTMLIFDLFFNIE